MKLESDFSGFNPVSQSRIDMFFSSRIARANRRRGKGVWEMGWRLHFDCQLYNITRVGVEIRPNRDESRAKM